MNGNQFEVGDRVVVSGGYDYEPAWLRGGDGYTGTLIELAGSVAVVELDNENGLHPWSQAAEALPLIARAKLVRDEGLRLVRPRLIMPGLANHSGG